MPIIKTTIMGNTITNINPVGSEFGKVVAILAVVVVVVVVDVVVVVGTLFVESLKHDPKSN
jgi:hypothetical protein